MSVYSVTTGELRQVVPGNETSMVEYLYGWNGFYKQHILEHVRRLVGGRHRMTLRQAWQRRFTATRIAVVTVVWVALFGMHSHEVSWVD